MPWRPINAHPRSTAPVTVYLLCFSKPLKHARHYLGVTARGDVEERLKEHRAGQGAKICAAAVAEGIELQLARTWENAPRLYEIKLKNRGGMSKHCPICKAAGRYTRKYYRPEATV